MNVYVGPDRELRIKELFSGVALETAEGNLLGVCMRDDALELNVMPGGVNAGNRWRVDMQAGTIVRMAAPAVPAESAEAYETFCDESYFGQWCVRPRGEHRFGCGYHVPSQDEAKGLKAELEELAAYRAGRKP